MTLQTRTTVQIPTQPINAPVSLEDSSPIPESVVGARSFSLVIANSRAELEEHLPPWEDLALHALEPNPFYEPWMLLPAMNLIGKELDLSTVLVYRNDGRGERRPDALCGMFPLERRSRYRGVPLSVLALWRHRYCFLSVPLIRAGYEKEVLRAFYDWLRTDPRPAQLIDFQRVPGDGPFDQALKSLLRETESVSFTYDVYPRAVLRAAGDADGYLRRAISREHRKDLRRRSRRLAERGLIEFRELECRHELDAWIEGFLQLERSGWKGQFGGAFDLQQPDREFFREVMRSAFDRDRLMMLGLELDGRALAYKCNVTAGVGSFAFKIAYDEEFRYFSPGVLLELENIKRFHNRESLTWMDSCANPEHPMIDRLWLDRRMIQSVVVSNGSRLGDLAVSALPLARRINRVVRGLHRRDSETENN